MRSLFLAVALAATTSSAVAEAPNARAAYVERRGLIESDTRCHLFTTRISAALRVGAAQARGTLLRGGWTDSGVAQLEQAVVDAARGRACDDARTLTAAANARTAFATWASAGTMNFPGWERTWAARKLVAVDGWRLSQEIDAPRAATFGVRGVSGTQHLVLVMPMARNQTPPISARLIMRDPSRARAVAVSLPQRMTLGVAAGVAPPNATQAVPSIRTVENTGGRQQAVFTFPDSAFAALVALDPRESVELQLETGRGTQSLYVEVGDVGAARAFLTIR